MTWRRTLIAVAITILFILAGCAETNTDTSGNKEEVDPARKVYLDNCSSCHGRSFGGGFGPSLQNVGLTYSEEEVQKVITDGVGRMPAQKQVKEEDRKELAKWLIEKTK
ncbi:cytochrome c [Mechercharimyces sp. CAU 1602]|nr:cytochrome c [Mechercharimyces sp. CAU 1602]